METIQQAWLALRDHRLRTLLCILGITIGVASVMAVSTISKGGNHVVYSELETFGLNSVWVYRDYRADSPLKRQRDGSGIDNDDYKALRDRAPSLGIAKVSPVVWPNNWRSRLKFGNRYSESTLIGVNEQYASMVNDELAVGRMFNSNDINRKQPVAIITPDIVEKLYGSNENAIGKQFLLRDRRFQVIGVLASKSRDFLASIGSEGGQNANDRVLMPYTVLQSLNNEKSIANFQIEVIEFDDAERSGAAVQQVLTQRHRNRFSYKYDTMAGYIKTSDRILGGVAIVGIVAASISLLVGGMGILNMMSTSVLERTREIGIRKSVGASEADIQRQFLLEAVMISLIGGALGLAIGYISSVVLARITEFPLIPSPMVLVGALLVSIAVGIAAGYLPARRAAKMHAVDALRTD